MTKTSIILLIVNTKKIPLGFNKHPTVATYSRHYFDHHTHHLRLLIHNVKSVLYVKKKAAGLLITLNKSKISQKDGLPVNILSTKPNKDTIVVCNNLSLSMKEIMMKVMTR